MIEALQRGLSINANGAFRTRVLGTVPIQSDGSFYVEVPKTLRQGGDLRVHYAKFAPPE